MKTTPKAQLRPLAATPQLRTRGPNSLETSPPATFSTPHRPRRSLRASPGGTPKLSDFRLEMQQAKANLDEQMAFTRAKALDASTAPTSMQRRASRGGGVSSTASRAAALASHDGKRLAACQTSLSSDRLALPVVRSPGKGLAAGSGRRRRRGQRRRRRRRRRCRRWHRRHRRRPVVIGRGHHAAAAARRPADSVPQPRQGIAPFPEERLLELLPSPEKGRSSAAADAAATPAAPAAAPSPAQPRATRGERRGSSSSDAAAGARARAAAHDGRLRRDAARARGGRRRVGGDAADSGQADRRAARGGVVALLVEQRDLEQAADSDHGAGGGGGGRADGAQRVGPRAACPRQQLLRRLERRRARSGSPSRSTRAPRSRLPRRSAPTPTTIGIGDGRDFLVFDSQRVSSTRGGLARRNGHRAHASCWHCTSDGRTCM